MLPNVPLDLRRGDSEDSLGEAARGGEELPLS